MGFKTTQEPTQTAELLSYTIFRDMNIPMGTPNISPSISMGAPMPPPQMVDIISRWNVRDRLIWKKELFNPLVIQVERANARVQSKAGVSF